MSEHTKGAISAAVALNHKYKITEVFGGGREGSVDPRHIAEIIDKHTAAPELLETCKQAEKYMDEGDWDFNDEEQLIKLIKNAIAKAENTRS